MNHLIKHLFGSSKNSDLYATVKNNRPGGPCWLLVVLAYTVASPISANTVFQSEVGAIFSDSKFESRYINFDTSGNSTYFTYYFKPVDTAVSAYAANPFVDKASFLDITRHANDDTNAETYIARAHWVNAADLIFQAAIEDTDGNPVDLTLGIGGYFTNTTALTLSYSTAPRDRDYHDISAKLRSYFPLSRQMALEIELQAGIFEPGPGGGAQKYGGLDAAFYPIRQLALAAGGFYMFNPDDPNLQSFHVAARYHFSEMIHVGLAFLEEEWLNRYVINSTSLLLGFRF